MEPNISKIFKTNIKLITKYFNLNWKIVKKFYFFIKKITDFKKEFSICYWFQTDALCSI